MRLLRMILPEVGMEHYQNPGWLTQLYRFFFYATSFYIMITPSYFPLARHGFPLAASTMIEFHYDLLIDSVMWRLRVIYGTRDMEMKEIILLSAHNLRKLSVRMSLYNEQVVSED